MSLARHCDGPDCDGWQMVHSAVAQMWLDVTEVEDGGLLHFCKWDCVLRYAATKEPVQVIDIP